MVEVGKTSNFPSSMLQFLRLDPSFDRCLTTIYPPTEVGEFLLHQRLETLDELLHVCGFVDGKELFRIVFAVSTFLGVDHRN